MPIEESRLSNPTEGVLRVAIDIKNDQTLSSELTYSITISGGSISDFTHKDTKTVPAGEIITQTYDFDVSGGNYKVCAEVIGSGLYSGADSVNPGSDFVR